MTKLVSDKDTMLHRTSRAKPKELLMSAMGRKLTLALVKRWRLDAFENAAIRSQIVKALSPSVV